MVRRPYGKSRLRISLLVIAGLALLVSMSFRTRAEPGVIYTDIGTGSVVWAFAIVTDTHVGEAGDGWDYGYRGWNDYLMSLPYGIGEPANRLSSAISTINSLVEGEKIKFVVHLGDMSDSGELSEQGITISLLNQLSVPWIPVIGNHDVWPYCNDKALNPRLRLNDHISSVLFVNPSSIIERVYLYEHAGYGGKSEPFISDVGNLDGSYVGNDEVSSVRAEGDCWATLYEHASYGGHYLNIKEAKNLDMNDAISSIEFVQQLGPGPYWVKVYEDANFGGQSKTYTSDVPNIPKMGPWWHQVDWISSAELFNCEVKFYKDANYDGDYIDAIGNCSNFDMGGGIHPGVSSLRVHNCNTRGVYLYEHANYGGRSELFINNYSNLDGSFIGNDEASSIRVIRGAEVALYADADFGGSYTLFREDDSDFNRRLEAREANPDKYFYNLYIPYVERLKPAPSQVQIWPPSGFTNIEIESMPVYNPEVGHNSYFFNYAFDYPCARRKPIHFIVLDFNSRQRAPAGAPGVPAEGDLHDFSGGTYQWLSNHISGLDNPTIILAHHILKINPVAFFSPGEYNDLLQLLYPHRSYLEVWFGGHGHENWEGWADWGGTHVIRVIETEACKEVAGGYVRIVRIHESVIPPYEMPR